MSKEMKVGQVWEDRNGHQWTITKIEDNQDLSYPVCAKRSEDSTQAWFTLDGDYDVNDYDGWELMKLVLDIQPDIENPIILEESEKDIAIPVEKLYTKEQFLDAIQLRIGYTEAQMQPFYTAAMDNILEVVTDPRYPAYKSFKKEFNL